MDVAAVAVWPAGNWFILRFWSGNVHVRIHVVSWLALPSPSIPIVHQRYSTDEAGSIATKSHKIHTSGSSLNEVKKTGPELYHHEVRRAARVSASGFWVRRAASSVARSRSCLRISSPSRPKSRPFCAGSEDLSAPASKLAGGGASDDLRNIGSWLDARRRSRKARSMAAQ